MYHFIMVRQLDSPSNGGNNDRPTFESKVLPLVAMGVAWLQGAARLHVRQPRTRSVITSPFINYKYLHQYSPNVPQGIVTIRD